MSSKEGVKKLDLGTTLEGYERSDIVECYYCGIEGCKEYELYQVYEPDINKVVNVCEGCLTSMKEGEL